MPASHPQGGAEYTLGHSPSIDWFLTKSSLLAGVLFCCLHPTSDTICNGGFIVEERTRVNDCTIYCSVFKIVIKKQQLGSCCSSSDKTSLPTGPSKGASKGSSTNTSSLAIDVVCFGEGGSSGSHLVLCEIAAVV